MLQILQFSNIIPPPGIIMCNNDLSSIVQEVLMRQLFIDRIMTGDEFDDLMSQDSGFATAYRNSGKRLLVIRPLNELQNRAEADVVLFIKEGLASVETNKFGPPGITLPVVNLTFSALGVYSFQT
jgi:hypothetical protein